MGNNYMKLIIERLKYLGLYSIKDYNYIVDIFNWLTKNDDVHVDLTKYVTTQQLGDFTSRLSSESSDAYESIMSELNSSATRMEPNFDALDAAVSKYGTSGILPEYINVSKLSNRYAVSENNSLTVVTNGDVTNGTRNFVIITDARGGVVTYGYTNIILRG